MEPTISLDSLDSSRQQVAILEPTKTNAYRCWKYRQSEKGKAAQARALEARKAKRRENKHVCTCQLRTPTELTDQKKY